MTTEQNIEISHSEAIEIGIANLEKLMSDLKRSSLANLLNRTRIMAIQYTITFLKEQVKEEQEES